jgi:hypothetical protein
MFRTILKLIDTKPDSWSPAVLIRLGPLVTRQKSKALQKCAQVPIRGKQESAEDHSSSLEDPPVKWR